MQQTVRAWKIGYFSNLVMLPAIFFIKKVKPITNNIDQHKLQTQDSITIVQTSLTIFLSFHPAAIAQLHTMMKNSKPTSCALDTIPTSLLLEFLDDILPTLTNIINALTLSGQFPTNMKTAIVEPFLRNSFDIDKF